MAEPLSDQSIRETNAAACKALDQKFRGSLTRYFSRHMPGGDIEDMVQDVFMRLLNRGNIANVDWLAGYVFQTASSVLRDRLRRHRSQHVADYCPFDPETHGDVDFSPERVLLGREQLAQLRAILLELPERSRAVFILRRIEGMRYQDIAAQFKVSVSSIEKDMLRATRHIAKRLEQDG